MTKETNMKPDHDVSGNSEINSKLAFFGNMLAISSIRRNPRLIDSNMSKKKVATK